ncbi:hypothetical protein THERMOT_179, partial [Bathymodiolus thermophilus thioautotrophic gill symbiont]
MKKDNTENDIFAWVEWFSELAKNIGKKNQNTLPASINEAIESVLTNKAIKNKKQSIVESEAYDPFSFFYYLAQKNTTNQRKIFFQEVDRVFNINSPLPDFDDGDCWIFPKPTAHTNVLYWQPNKYEPELLWRFFHKIMTIKNIDELPLKATDDEFSNEFQAMLNLSGVGVSKLTETLFLIN